MESTAIAGRTTTGSRQQPVVSVVGLGKVFGSTIACADVSFDLYPGELLALVGENGAGKSTCVKMIGGVYIPDAGEVLLDGEPIKVRNAMEARAKGIAVVHQHPEIFAELSVAENVFAGQPLLTSAGLIDQAAMQRESERLLRTLGIDRRASTPVGSLRVSEQQLVEIARALASNARVLILDEPTAALTTTEVDRLFDVVARLKSEGVALMFVGHRLEEVLRVSDRITVMRDGRYVSTVDAAATTADDLVKLMVGRTIANLYERTAHTPGATILETRSLSIDGKFDDVSITVKAGEVVGLAGLVGSGRSEVARTIFGIDHPTSGEIVIDGKPVRIRSAAAALHLGVAYVSEDRRGQSIIEEFSILENATLPMIGMATTRGFLRHSKELGLVRESLLRMRLKFASYSQPIGGLSGGNQQKVVLAKWLATSPKLLILDEPTQGVDIQAKAEVHRIIDQLAGQGIAVLMISSDMPELLGGADRIYVMNHGQVVEELSRAEATQIEIGRAATDPRYATAHTDSDEEGALPLWRRVVSTISTKPEFGLALALLTVILPLSLLNTNFYKSSNLYDIADYASLIGLAALGQMLVILTRNIDLSVASIIGLTAYCAAYTMRAHPGAPIALGILAGVGVGALCGLFNGLVVAYGRVPSIVVTLGTLAVFRGLLSQISAGDRITPTDVPRSWLDFTKYNAGPISTVVVVAVVAYVSLGFLLRRTRRGREIYFSGSNPHGASLIGIPTKRRVLNVFVASGTLCGVAGTLWASYYPYVDGQVAVGLETTIIAAVVVGGVALRGGAGSVMGVAIGVVGLLALRKVLIIAGVDEQYLQAVYGASIIVAVTFDVFLNRRRSRQIGRIR